MVFLNHEARLGDVWRVRLKGLKDVYILILSKDVHLWITDNESYGLFSAESVKELGSMASVEKEYIHDSFAENLMDIVVSWKTLRDDYKDIRDFTNKVNSLAYYIGVKPLALMAQRTVIGYGNESFGINYVSKLMSKEVKNSLKIDTYPFWVTDLKDKRVDMLLSVGDATDTGYGVCFAACKSDEGSTKPYLLVSACETMTAKDIPKSAYTKKGDLKSSWRDELHKRGLLSIKVLDDLVKADKSLQIHYFLDRSNNLLKGYILISL